MQKQCKECGESKSVDLFYRHAQMADGYLNQCKECVKARVIAHRQQSDRPREYDRIRSKTPERRALNDRVSKKWRKKNPEKYSAQNAVNNAVRDGRLNKAEECENCGSGDDIHGHHEDYSRPLDVIWLCARCHKKVHTVSAAGGLRGRATLSSPQQTKSL